MEYDKIKQLMEDMGNSKLTSIDIDFPDGTKISMKKEEKQVVKVVETQEIAESKRVNTTTNVEENNIEMVKYLISIGQDVNAEENFNIVKSPMVGTFYLKPSPDSEPYVQVGQKVKRGDTLCIIEAMKLMNEIESEFDGEIAEVLLKDGEMVEYGKPLFKIK